MARDQELATIRFRQVRYDCVGKSLDRLAMDSKRSLSLTWKAKRNSIDTRRLRGLGRQR